MLCASLRYYFLRYLLVARHECGEINAGGVDFTNGPAGYIFQVVHFRFDAIGENIHLAVSHIIVGGFDFRRIRYAGGSLELKVGED